MDITKFPQFHLYLLTLHLLMKKQILLPTNSDIRCVNATIINRAYYSSYSYCELWLDYVKKFKTLRPWEFDDGEEYVSEHKQVRNALYSFNEERIGFELNNLFELRKKS